MKTRQLFLLLLLVGAVMAFMILDFGRFVSLDYLKQSQTTFLALYDQSSLRVGLTAFMKGFGVTTVFTFSRYV